MNLDPSTAQQCVDYWRGIMLIEPRWEIRLHVVSDDDMPDDCSGCEAAIFATPYWSADLYLNPSRIKDADELDRTVVHELLHMHLKPLELMARIAHKEELVEWEGERLIEVIADVIVGLERRFQQAKARRRK
jgi:hypothetical protein